MKNKILIRVCVPSITEEYNLFIPTNSSVGNTIKLLIKCINDLSDNMLVNTNNYCIIDPDTSEVYANNLLIRNTNITNYKKIILV